MKRSPVLIIPIILIVFTSFYIYSPQAAHGEDQPLVGSMKGFWVNKNEKGEETLIETEKILPGQTIEYQVMYSNNSPKKLRNVTIIGPVPKNTSYIGGSATVNESMPTQFSIDGGKTYSAEPVKYLKTLPDGTQEEAIATPDMYTQIRWIIPSFDKGVSVTYKYRVVVK